MPVVTRAELENAQRDVDDLGKVINGAADLANPGQDPGTVTTRLGAIIKTLSKLVADGQDTVQERLTPLVYQSTVERENAISAVGAGQTGFDREDSNLYIAIPHDDPQFDGQLQWDQVSNLQLAASATTNDLLERKTAVGRVSVDDYYFLANYDKVYDKDALLVHHIQVPIKTGTANNGIERLLNYDSLPTRHHWQEGVDFGCRIPYGDLKDASDPQYGLDWLPDTKRVMLRNDNNNVLEGFLINGYVDISSGYQKTAYITDCWIDANFEKLQAVQKNNGAEYPMVIQNCKLRRVTSEGSNVFGGKIMFSDIEYSRGDGLKASGDGVVIHGCMTRFQGHGLVTAHGDCLQVLDCQGLEVTQNMFYMPGTGTHWDEQTYGSTQALRLVTENPAHRITDAYIAGNYFVGGGFTIAVRSRQIGALVENIAIVNNIIAGSHTDPNHSDPNQLHPFPFYGYVTQEHWAENSPGTFRNMIMWGNRVSSGTEADFKTVGWQGDSPQNGLWHYDKEYATPRFLELGKRLGLLDWNGDPLVANRTTG